MKQPGRTRQRMHIVLTFSLHLTIASGTVACSSDSHDTQGPTVAERCERFCVAQQPKECVVESMAECVESCEMANEFMTSVGCSQEYYAWLDCSGQEGPDAFVCMGEGVLLPSGSETCAEPLAALYACQDMVDPGQ